MEKNEEKFYLIDKDVRGYYPNLILTLELYPSSMGINFFKAYKAIVDKRENAKANKIFSVDKGLKIVVNGASGKFSDPYSYLYGPDLTIQMTVTGQLALLMFIEQMEINGITAVSANTDGVVLKCPKSKRILMDEITKHWEAITGLQTEETEYRAYYARDVNNYCAVKLDGSVKVKGSISEKGSQSGTQLDTNPTSQICTDAIIALLSKGTPIEKTIRECKDFTRFVTVRQAKAPGAHKSGEYLGRVIRWYYAKGELGCIQTVQTNNKVADTDGAKPCLDLPEIFPDDINYAWYEAKCREILEEIGYSQKPRQIAFF